MLTFVAESKARHEHKRQNLMSDDAVKVFLNLAEI